MHRRLLLIGASLMLSCALDAHGKQARNDSHCDVPGYFGICDPYVPGTIISFEEKQPIHVIDTWHDGPAERAGVCAGDRMVAVNGIPASESTSDRMLHEIVSDRPSPVLLTIKRGDQKMEFRIRRVRESTLAKLSHRKYFNAPDSWRSEMLVPQGEKRGEYTRYIDFLKRLEGREGFTRIDGVSVPVETPPEQVKRLKEFQMRGPGMQSMAGFIGPTAGQFSFGFTALVLSEPREVLIEAVLPNSPAHRTGLLPGDRVLEVDGREVSGMTFGNFKALILEPDKERTISIKVDRGAHEQTIPVRSENFDELVAADLTQPIRGPARQFSPENYFLGIEFLYSSDLREAMVEEVEWPSPAFDAGLHVGDALLAINGKPISGMTREDMGKLLVPTDASPMAFEVSRLGRKKTFKVKPVTYRSAQGTIGRKWTESGFVPETCQSN